MDPRDAALLHDTGLTDEEWRAEMGRIVDDQAGSFAARMLGKVLVDVLDDSEVGAPAPDLCLACGAYWRCEHQKRRDGLIEIAPDGPRLADRTLGPPLPPPVVARGQQFAFVHQSARIGGECDTLIPNISKQTACKCGEWDLREVDGRVLASRR